MQPRICRLCIKQTHNAINVFQHHFDSSAQSLVEILFWTFLIEVDVSDSFSKFICVQCLCEIENVVSLRKTFKKNQTLLKEGVEQLLNNMNNTAKNECDSVEKDQSVEKDACLSTNYENSRSIRDKDRIAYRTELSDIDGLIIEELTLHNEEIKSSFSCEDEDHRIGSIGNKNILDGWPKFSCKLSQSTSTDLTMEDVEELLRRSFCDKNTDGQYIKISKSNLTYFSPRVSVENFESTVANEEYEQVDERTFKKQYNSSPKKLSSDCEYLKVPKYALDIFGPKVTLTDIKNTPDFQNYQQISDFTYKIYPSRNTESQRKMKYIDYYYNYNSCALRELITEKSMQYSEYSAGIDEPEIDSAAICGLCNSKCSCEVNYDVLYTTCRKVCDFVGSRRNQGLIKKPFSYKQARYIKSLLHLKRIRHYRMKRKTRIKKKLKRSIIQNMYYKHFGTNILDSSVSTTHKDCKFNKFLRNTINKLSQRLLPTVVIK